MAAPTTDKSLKSCRCSLFEVGEFDAEKDGPSFTTECDRQTNRLFAQGHDARLVSFLVKGQLDGYTIRSTGGVTFPDAIAAAKSISDALAIKAATMLANAEAKAKAKAEREAEKATKKAAAANAKQAPAEPEPAPKPEAKPTPRRRGKAAPAN
jgi:uncharacterized protein with WD repeat